MEKTVMFRRLYHAARSAAALLAAAADGFRFSDYLNRCRADPLSAGGSF